MVHNCDECQKAGDCDSEALHHSAKAALAQGGEALSKWVFSDDDPQDTVDRLAVAIEHAIIDFATLRQFADHFYPELDKASESKRRALIKVMQVVFDREKADLFKKVANHFITAAEILQVNSGLARVGDELAKELAKAPSAEKRHLPPVTSAGKVLH